MVDEKHHWHENIDGDISELSPWRQRMHIIIFGYETTAGKLFDLGLLLAILVSIVVVMLESVQSIKIAHGDALFLVEWVITILFTIEYVARIISSPNPKKYIFSAMGIIDLLSILPTFIALFAAGANALLVLRSIRLIRVFRILKLTHFVGGADQIGKALLQSRFKIIVFLGSVVCVTFIAGTVMYMVEGAEHGFTSIPKSVYWAIVTLTTVGYGDIAPQTILGQSLASLLMVLGYAIIAVPTGIVTSEMMNAKNSYPGPDCPRCNTSLPIKANYCMKCGEKQLTTEVKK